MIQVMFVGEITGGVVPSSQATSNYLNTEDGWPTYNFRVFFSDHESRITTFGGIPTPNYVIRGRTIFGLTDSQFTLGNSNRFLLSSYFVAI